ncbi:MAG: DUF502 domain-containing protein [Gammaproteobacteria bacterium]|nr:DUF502 domain-containing protein [Gammaproteobacteria bacterium]
MMHRFRRYFISGLLVWLPVVVTVFVIRFLVDLLDSTLMLLPRNFRPDALLGVHIPGIGVVLTVVVIVTTGLVVANILGKKLVELWDGLIGRIPLVRVVYNAVKQVSVTLFAPGGKSFRKVLLVEFPRAGMWSIAFQTGDSTPEVDRAVGENDMVSIFIPATPNPTSGFLMMMPRKDIIELDMTVDQALKYVISLGVIQPNGVQSKTLKQD